MENMPLVNIAYDLRAVVEFTGEVVLTCLKEDCEAADTLTLATVRPGWYKVILKCEIADGETTKVTGVRFEHVDVVKIELKECDTANMYTRLTVDNGILCIFDKGAYIDGYKEASEEGLFYKTFSNLAKLYKKGFVNDSGLVLDLASGEKMVNVKLDNEKRAYAWVISY